MATEAQKKATAKYKKNSVKQLKIEFFPDDHELLEKVKEKGKAYGGLYKYVKDVLRKDIENGE